MIAKKIFVLAMFTGGLAACERPATLMDERCAQYGDEAGAETGASTDGKGVVHLEPPVAGDCVAPPPPVVPELPPDDDDDDDDDNGGNGNGGNGNGGNGNGGHEPPSDPQGSGAVAGDEGAGAGAVQGNEASVAVAGPGGAGAVAVEGDESSGSGTP